MTLIKISGLPDYFLVLYLASTSVDWSLKKVVVKLLKVDPRVVGRHSGSRLVCAALCVPSMGENQRGSSPPFARMITALFRRMVVRGVESDMDAVKAFCESAGKRVG